MSSGPATVSVRVSRPDFTDSLADIHLRSGLTDGSGRPPGMFPPAPEEALWVSLNQWVVDNELQPSAERGPEGPTKFTNYPLSQSLLREGDEILLKFLCHNICVLIQEMHELGITSSFGVALARIHRRTPMDGVRTAEGGG